MIYTEREQLTIIELKEKRDTLSYVELTSDCYYGTYTQVTRGAIAGGKNQHKI